jgi:CBS domain-containing protein
MAIVRDVMMPNPVSLEAGANLLDAAKAMRDADVGAVVVVRGDQICGIVTDRDLVVRAMAEGRDPARTRLEEISSTELATVEPLHTVQDAAQVMSERHVQRLPVVAEGMAVGIVSLADLAPHLEPHSALADVTGTNAKH